MCACGNKLHRLHLSAAVVKIYVHSFHTMASNIRLVSHYIHWISYTTCETISINDTHVEAPDHSIFLTPSLLYWRMSWNGFWNGYWILSPGDFRWKKEHGWKTNHPSEVKMLCKTRICVNCKKTSHTAHTQRHFVDLHELERVKANTTILKLRFCMFVVYSTSGHGQLISI